ncbi:IS3 family transposase [Paenibacillus sp. CCS19]|uniref:IS3 family transposase n=1 Tax=Paenibacillus sp. CCS19 TaxID=3158387 RepID=UPI00331301BA
MEEYIHVYNHRRPQRRLNKLTPVQYQASFQNKGFFLLSTNKGFDQVRTGFFYSPNSLAL